MVIFAMLGEKTYFFFLIFHGIICSHILNWTSVIVFSEWRIFLHFLCDHCVFSLQVSASSLRTPPTQYVECWISKCDCNRRVCFQSVTVTFQCFCLTPVLQHPGKQPCQFVCAADHSKVRSSSAAHSYSQFSTFLHAHTTCEQHFYFCYSSPMLLVHRTCVGLTLSSFLQFPRCDDASILQEPVVLCFLHCLPLHRTLLHHEPGMDHIAKSPATGLQF